ncbi:MAG: Uncharacterised protein [Formosa sp. Hel1_33_131]|nr:MAG: Uncharacterised protein [Formosa sp. Hel1_33_131]
MILFLMMFSIFFESLIEKSFAVISTAPLPEIIIVALINFRSTLTEDMF